MADRYLTGVKDSVSKRLGDSASGDVVEGDQLVTATNDR